jgi:hypothetical protein
MSAAQGIAAKPSKKSAQQVRRAAHRVWLQALPIERVGSGVLCRIVHPRGYLIECTQWPPPGSLESLIDGLVTLARDVIQQDPSSGALFAFINVRRNKLKLLIWETQRLEASLGNVYGPVIGNLDLPCNQFKKIRL